MSIKLAGDNLNCPNAVETTLAGTNQNKSWQRYTVSNK